MVRKLGEQLVSDGVLTPELLARALERQKATGQKLGECLVRLGLDETPVLRVLAQEFKTRFVSTAKLAQVRIEPELIERVPVRLAEGFDFVPLRVDESGVLYIAISEPQRQRAIEEICRTVGVERVLPFVAVRRSIRAAIRKHYYADPQAFEHMPDDDACPHCGAPIQAGDFQCDRCELLLVRSPEDLPPRDNVSLVRSLLSIPDRQLAREVPSPPHHEKTRVASYSLDAVVAAQIPTIAAGLDIAEKALNPFEAYILSFVDGRTSLADIARITALSEVELHAIFESLSERGITRVTSPKPPSARRSPPAPEKGSAPAPAPAPAQAKKAAPARAQGQPPPPAKEERQPAAEPRPADRNEDVTQGVLQLVVLLERSGKIDEAVEVLDRGISQLPKPAPLYNRLGMILLNQRRDYAKAMELFQKAADLDPDNTTYMMNLYTVLSLKADATNPGKRKAKR
ncbi:GspE/PulE/PilB domain-containing protein [Hyalangium versicolor]|uniref:GspE/PulE/PilB domain-containing protein n=1 Tax=Hyalangium versicolor TaxID=2861190 RepID=UPI001CCD4713|nr:general secretion pathway protein GspE [Hyalangium versicolor]